MGQLKPSVRIAASSIFLLSLVHILFWAFLAVVLRKDLPLEFPYNYLIPIFWIIAAAGALGLLVALGIFQARNWARISAIALGVVVAFFCAFGMSVPLLIVFGALPLATLGLDVRLKNDFVRLFVVYFLVFALAVWWIFLFSKKSTVAQFSTNAGSVAPAEPRKPACPPPIALLAWLMIVSGALSGLSWPLILERIPAMLFTHIFSVDASQWIWGVNIALFLACGIGLLKLQSWSYTGTVALHIFWLVSLFASQVSSGYESYMRICLNALEIPQNYPGLNLLRFPQWASALVTAIPTALLIAGLFYYRRSFNQAVADSRHLSA
ncbi:MAG TPA: hypothetical protein VN025_09915 [Candidatus Dormibacteraeota bacterium]|jgi:hypothetical protein|nr:hypothetical protein [Candidatus Dormibacteraeota bacterium]